MDMNIGARLDEAMKDAKIESQSQLARSSGVPQPTINRILKGQGKQGPETATLLPLARALSVELRWLQTGQGPKRLESGGQSGGGEASDAAPQLRVVENLPTHLLQWVSHKEAELLSKFRECEAVEQESLLAIANGYASTAAQGKRRDKA